MAESVNKKLLSALTEGHEKELRSSARISKTSTLEKQASPVCSGNSKSPKIQKNSVNDSFINTKRKLSKLAFTNFNIFFFKDFIVQ